MCDCVQKLEDKIFKEMFLKEMAEVVVINPSCHFENGYIGGSYPLYAPIRVDYFQQTKGGKEVKRHKVYNMTFSYCPFCGEKINKEETK
ncbi:hypothetical protein [Desulfosporosinus sp. SB140]|uniref:hypothetical protein n=1 Tax=Desulfosporosinus paludis TaxID=3115649 RepID=UPI00388E56CC